jgi:alpha-beta hydrolase superfamily lysophospholipase
VNEKKGMRPGPTLPSVCGGAPLATYVHTPGVHVRGVAVFFHGIAMHAQMRRYDALYRAMESEGYEVWAWDCPHHGRSSSLGDPAHPLRPLRLPRAHDLLSDAAQFVHAARDARPSLPVVLVGESMGAVLALRLATVVRPQGVSLLAGAVLPRVSYVSGMLRLARMACMAPRKSRVETRKDPLVHVGVIPPSVGWTMDALTRTTEHAKLACPVLFVVGTRDPLTPVPYALRTLVKCTGAPVLRRSIHVAEGARHDNLVEVAPDVVAAFCADVVV